MKRFPREDYRALSRYAPDRRPVALDLSDNTNQWGTHPGALRFIRESDADRLRRYPNLYADDLRTALSRRFDLAPEHFCTGCGSDDVLDATFRAAASQGGLVRYPVPTFSMIGPLARMNGRTEGGVSWPRALDDPACLLEDDPAIVYVCRPNNPTGHQPSSSWLETVVSAAAERGDRAPVVIVDEAYAEFAGESFMSEAPRLDRVLVARTFSKAYGLAGLRVGWAVGSAELIGEVEKARGPFKVSRLAEGAAAAAIEDEEGWVDRTVAECVENRGRLLIELEERGLRPVPSQASFVFFPVPSGTARERALELREYDVAVRPFVDEGGVGDGLRVSVGPWSLMESFLEALDGAREAGPQRWDVPDAEERLARLRLADPS